MEHTNAIRAKREKTMHFTDEQLRTIEEALEFALSRRLAEFERTRIAHDLGMRRQAVKWAKQARRISSVLDTVREQIQKVS